jgi:hypothetical protein
MKSRLDRFFPAAMVLLLFLGSAGCASWLQLGPSQPVEPYRGLNESSILTKPY